jgi:hypothetical protein
LTRQTDDGGSLLIAPHTVRVGDITVTDGRRPVSDTAWLADSIHEVGLLNPITVTPDLRLIAGRNHLEAYRALGCKEMPVTIEERGPLAAELAEMDENLIRNDLTALERSESLAQRKRVYLTLHSSTAQHLVGGHGKAAQAASAESALAAPIPLPLPFMRDTAQKTGQSERAVQVDVQIAEKLTAETKAVVRDTDLADKKSKLLELSRVDPRHQHKVAEKGMSDDAPTVKAANRQIESELVGRVFEVAPDDANRARGQLRLTFTTHIRKMRDFAFLVPDAVAEVIDERDYQSAVRLKQGINAWFGKLAVAPKSRLLVAKFFADGIGQLAADSRELPGEGWGARLRSTPVRILPGRTHPASGAIDDCELGAEFNLPKAGTSHWMFIRLVRPDWPAFSEHLLSLLRGSPPKKSHMNALAVEAS